MDFNEQQINYLTSVLEKRKAEIYHIYWGEGVGDFKDDEGSILYLECCDALHSLYGMLLKPIQVTRTITYGTQEYMEYCADMDRTPSQGDFYDWVEGLVYDDFREPVELDFLTFKEVDNI